MLNVMQALRYNEVESILENGEQEDIFSSAYFVKLSDIKMPASKLEILVKMVFKDAFASQASLNSIRAHSTPLPESKVLILVGIPMLSALFVRFLY